MRPAAPASFPDQKRERDRRVDVDPHQPGGLRVLRGRAHRLALAGAVDEPGQDHDERDRHADREHVGAADDDAGDRDDRVVLVDEVVDARR